MDVVGFGQRHGIWYNFVLLFALVQWNWSYGSSLIDRFAWREVLNGKVNTSTKIAAEVFKNRKLRSNSKKRGMSAYNITPHEAAERSISKNGVGDATGEENA